VYVCVCVCVCVFVFVCMCVCVCVRARAREQTLAVDFDSETDMGGYTFALLQKDGVDSLFSFTEPLGSDYVGIWTSNRQFIVTILDWPGAGPPQV